MTQNKVLPEPGHEEYAKCSTLVSKVIILQDHRYSEDEISLADHLLKFQWNPNVTDFLHVVAGIAHPGMEVDEAYGALVFPIKQQ
jgi:hypothetical protein